MWQAPLAVTEKGVCQTFVEWAWVFLRISGCEAPTVSSHKLLDAVFRSRVLPDTHVGWKVGKPNAHERGGLTIKCTIIALPNMIEFHRMVAEQQSYWPGGPDWNQVAVWGLRWVLHAEAHPGQQADQRHSQSCKHEAVCNKQLLQFGTIQSFDAPWTVRVSQHSRALATIL